MARLVDSIEVPAAKAAILWVMGEYCERVPKIAPDVLRKMAKTFTNEDPAVKMQVVNVGVELRSTHLIEILPDDQLGREAVSDQSGADDPARAVRVQPGQV